MTNAEAVELLRTERAAMNRIIELAMQQKATAGGDAQDTLNYVVRRRNVLTAMDMAIGSLNKEVAYVGENRDDRRRI